MILFLCTSLTQILDFFNSNDAIFLVVLIPILEILIASKYKYFRNNSTKKDKDLGKYILENKSESLIFLGFIITSLSFFLASGNTQQNLRVFILSLSFLIFSFSISKYSFKRRIYYRIQEQSKEWGFILLIIGLGMLLQTNYFEASIPLFVLAVIIIILDIHSFYKLLKYGKRNPQL